MRAVVQKVRSASVSVAGVVAGRIDTGLLVFAAVAEGDAERDLDYIAKKIQGLRIFCDPKEPGKINTLSVAEIGGAVLMISQFTLMGDVRRGLRPSFSAAEEPGAAKLLFDHLVEKVKESGLPVETGRFGEDMQVELVNNGPVTILLDSKKIF